MDGLQEHRLGRGVGAERLESRPRSDCSAEPHLALAPGKSNPLRIRRTATGTSAGQACWAGLLSHLAKSRVLLHNIKADTMWLFIQSSHRLVEFCLPKEYVLGWRTPEGLAVLEVPT